ncbi:molybdopterin molybdotransferase MoeA, partial [Craterilacuibacter sp.]|uniref:molybdopterin molybdotransferase MoeA n=1 Tax=Craterilacuibacter sp. TaxID=2870909 RepID=UPI003F2BC5F8
MLDYHAALAQLLANLTPKEGCEQVSLAHASGRRLAENLLARFDSPQFDNSAMDGYAIHDPAGEALHFNVVHRVAAGEVANMTISKGEAVRIFTGAPLPLGTTAVVPQEDTTRDGHVVALHQPARVGQHMRMQAEEYAAGAVLLAAGTLLGPAAIALAASQGYAVLPVRPRLQVTVFSSGNELIEPGGELMAGKIFDANRYQLLAWLSRFELDVTDGGILPDDAATTGAALVQASQESDVILTSGGVSVGEEDHLRAALEAIGEISAWKLAIKPGKPFAWGRAGRAHVFMLPGNPVATFVTFHQLVAPALRRLAGDSEPLPRAISVRAGFVKTKAEPRREFQRVRLVKDGDAYRAELIKGQGSAMLSACAVA